MRFIKYQPSKLAIRADWYDDARKILDELESETDEEKRADIVDAHSGLWQELKHELAKVFHQKCWYTETKQEGTDTDVDHFRPKKRVSEASKHPGYWWLAFELKNYRYSCIYANRRRRDVETGETGGKADHFPIQDERQRAWCSNDDCNDEEPVLLDPCKAGDVNLLMFKPDGEAAPRYNEQDHPKKYLRAAISIRLYNLNHSDFVKARISLRDEIEALLERAEQFYKKLETGDQTAADAYSNAIEDLVGLTRESSPHSAFCIDILRPKRTEEFLDGVSFG